MNTVIKIISRLNRLLGRIGQLTIYVIVCIASLILINGNVPDISYNLFQLIGEYILSLLFLFNAALFFATVILVFMHKIKDSDDNEGSGDFWIIIYFLSFGVVPFYTWRTFINTTISRWFIALIWMLQSVIFFNSYLYNAFLKQY